MKLKRESAELALSSSASHAVIGFAMVALGGAGFAVGTGVQLLFTVSPLWPVSLLFGLSAVAWLYGVEVGALRSPTDATFAHQVARKLVFGLLLGTPAMAGIAFYFHHRATDWGRSFYTAGSFVGAAVVLDLLLIGLPTWIMNVRRRTKVAGQRSDPA